MATHISVSRKSDSVHPDVTALKQDVASVRYLKQSKTDCHKDVTALRKSVTSMRYKNRLSQWFNDTKPGRGTREISETNENRLSELVQLQITSFLASYNSAWLSAKSPWPANVSYLQYIYSSSLGWHLSVTNPQPLRRWWQRCRIKFKGAYMNQSLRFRQNFYSLVFGDHSALTYIKLWH